MSQVVPKALSLQVAGSSLVRQQHGAASSRGTVAKVAVNRGMAAKVVERVVVPLEVVQFPGEVPRRMCLRHCGAKGKTRLNLFKSPQSGR